MQNLVKERSHWEKNAHKVDAREKVNKLNAKLKVLAGRLFHVSALAYRVLGKLSLIEP